VSGHRGRIPALAIVLLSLLAASHAATQSPSDSTSPPPDSLPREVAPGRPAGDPRLGERTYMKNCANCHRADGRGGRQPTATGEPVPSFREIGYWDGKTDSALVAVIENGVPNTSMVAWKDVLRADEIQAVTRFVRQRFGPRAKPATAEPAQPAAKGASADTTGS